MGGTYQELSVFPIRWCMVRDLISIDQVLALGEFGIRINAICPGIVEGKRKKKN